MPLKLNPLLHLHNPRSWPICTKIFFAKQKKSFDVWGRGSPCPLDPPMDVHKPIITQKAYFKNTAKPPAFYAVIFCYVSHSQNWAQGTVCMTWSQWSTGGLYDRVKTGWLTRCARRFCQRKRFSSCWVWQTSTTTLRSRTCST